MRSPHGRAVAGLLSGDASIRHLRYGRQMRRPLTALAVAVALTGTLSACGGDDTEFSDVVPETTPALVAPEDTGLPAAPSQDENTSTTTTSTTETTPTDTTGAAGSGTATPAPVTPQQSTPQQSAPQSGGTATPGTTQQEQQGGGNSGGFSDFCAQNPGACPDE